MGWFGPSKEQREAHDEWERQRHADKVARRQRGAGPEYLDIDGGVNVLTPKVETVPVKAAPQRMSPAERQKALEDMRAEAAAQRASGAVPTVPADENAENDRRELSVDEAILRSAKDLRAINMMLYRMPKTITRAVTWGVFSGLVWFTVGMFLVGVVLSVFGVIGAVMGVAARR